MHFGSHLAANHCQVNDSKEMSILLVLLFDMLNML